VVNAGSDEPPADAVGRGEGVGSRRDGYHIYIFTIDHGSLGKKAP
jgi:hypothetical protein